MCVVCVRDMCACTCAYVPSLGVSVTHLSAISLLHKDIPHIVQAFITYKQGLVTFYSIEVVSLAQLLPLTRLCMSNLVPGSSVQSCCPPITATSAAAT